jgi:serine O-acetyltransferase
MNDKFKNDFLWSDKVQVQIHDIITKILDSYKNDNTIAHIQKYPIPSKKKIIKILRELFNIVFPGFFTKNELNKTNTSYYIGNKVLFILESLSEEIAKSFRHTHEIKDDKCELCCESLDKGIEVALHLLENIPEIRRKLTLDVNAGYDGDPAAKSFDEIVFSYPGLFTIAVHRLAHVLYEKKISLIPRIMSEYSHSLTGIDIHPGAKIGENFFIDHGTGVVIGETCIIGNNVKLYQGVTLGALSFPKDEKGRLLKGLQRHPIIEDNVTIYSGATILGGTTVIGKNSVIGGNVWIVSSIPPNSKVSLADPDSKIIVETKKNKN